MPSPDSYIGDKPTPPAPPASILQDIQQAIELEPDAERRLAMIALQEQMMRQEEQKLDQQFKEITGALGWLGALGRTARSVVQSEPVSNAFENIGEGIAKLGEHPLTKYLPSTLVGKGALQAMEHTGLQARRWWDHALMASNRLPDSPVTPDFSAMQQRYQELMESGLAERLYDSGHFQPSLIDRLTPWQNRDAEIRALAMELARETTKNTPLVAGLGELLLDPLNVVPFGLASKGGRAAAKGAMMGRQVARGGQGNLAQRAGDLAAGGGRAVSDELAGLYGLPFAAARGIGRAAGGAIRGSAFAPMGVGGVGGGGVPPSSGSGSGRRLDPDIRSNIEREIESEISGVPKTVDELDKLIAYKRPDNAPPSRIRPEDRSKYMETHTPEGFEFPTVSQDFTRSLGRLEGIVNNLERRKGMLQNVSEDDLTQKIDEYLEQINALREKYNPYVTQGQQQLREMWLEHYYQQALRAVQRPDADLRTFEQSWDIAQEKFKKTKLTSGQRVAEYTAVATWGLGSAVRKNDPSYTRQVAKQLDDAVRKIKKPSSRSNAADVHLYNQQLKNHEFYQDVFEHIAKRQEQSRVAEEAPTAAAPTEEAVASKPEGSAFEELSDEVEDVPPPEAPPTAVADEASAAIEPELEYEFTVDGIMEDVDGNEFRQRLIRDMSNHAFSSYDIRKDGNFVGEMWKAIDPLLDSRAAFNNYIIGSKSKNLMSELESIVKEAVADGRVANASDTDIMRAMYMSARVYNDQGRKAADRKKLESIARMLRGASPPPEGPPPVVDSWDDAFRDVDVRKSSNDENYALVEHLADMVAKNPHLWTPQMRKWLEDTRGSNVELANSAAAKLRAAEHKIVGDYLMSKGWTYEEIFYSPTPKFEEVGAAPEPATSTDAGAIGLDDEDRNRVWNILKELFLRTDTPKRSAKSYKQAMGKKGPPHMGFPSEAFGKAAMDIVQFGHQNIGIALRAGNRKDAEEIIRLMHRALESWGAHGRAEQLAIESVRIAENWLVDASASRPPPPPSAAAPPPQTPPAAAAEPQTTAAPGSTYRDVISPEARELVDAARAELTKKRSTSTSLANAAIRAFEALLGDVDAGRFDGLDGSIANSIDQDLSEVITAASKKFDELRRPTKDNEDIMDIAERMLEDFRNELDVRATSTDDYLIETPEPAAAGAPPREPPPPDEPPVTAAPEPEPEPIGPVNAQLEQYRKDLRRFEKMVVQPEEEATRAQVVKDIKENIKELEPKAKQEFYDYHHARLEKLRDEARDMHEQAEKTGTSSEVNDALAAFIAAGQRLRDFERGNMDVLDEIVQQRGDEAAESQIELAEEIVEEAPVSENQPADELLGEAARYKGENLAHATKERRDELYREWLLRLEIYDFEAPIMKILKELDANPQKGKQISFLNRNAPIPKYGELPNPQAALFRALLSDAISVAGQIKDPAMRGMLRPSLFGRRLIDEEWMRLKLRAEARHARLLHNAPILPFKRTLEGARIHIEEQRKAYEEARLRWESERLEADEITMATAEANIAAAEKALGSLPRPRKTMAQMRDEIAELSELRATYLAERKELLSESPTGKADALSDEGRARAGWLRRESARLYRSIKGLEEDIQKRSRKPKPPEPEPVPDPKSLYPERLKQLYFQHIRLQEARKRWIYLYQKIGPTDPIRGEELYNYMRYRIDPALRELSTKINQMHAEIKEAGGTNFDEGFKTQYADPPNREIRDNFKESISASDPRLYKTISNPVTKFFTKRAPMLALQSAFDKMYLAAFPNTRKQRNGMMYDADRPGWLDMHVLSTRALGAKQIALRARKDVRKVLNEFLDPQPNGPPPIDPDELNTYLVSSFAEDIVKHWKEDDKIIPVDYAITGLGTRMANEAALIKTRAAVERKGDAYRERFYEAVSFITKTYYDLLNQLVEVKAISRELADDLHKYYPHYNPIRFAERITVDVGEGTTSMFDDLQKGTTFTAARGAPLWARQVSPGLKHLTLADAKDNIQLKPLDIMDDMVENSVRQVEYNRIVNTMAEGLEADGLLFKADQFVGGRLPPGTKYKALWYRVNGKQEQAYAPADAVDYLRDLRIAQSWPAEHILRAAQTPFKLAFTAANPVSQFGLAVTDFITAMIKYPQSIRYMPEMIREAMKHERGVDSKWFAELERHGGLPDEGPRMDFTRGKSHGNRDRRKEIAQLKKNLQHRIEEAEKRGGILDRVYNIPMAKLREKITDNDQLWMSAKDIMHHATYTGRVSEKAIRGAVAKAVYKDSGDMLWAVTRGRDFSIDFNDFGSMVGLVDAWLVYFKAGVGGALWLPRSFGLLGGRKTPGVAWRLAAGLGGTTLATYAWNAQFDAYFDQPADVRLSTFQIVIPTTDYDQFGNRRVKILNLFQTREMTAITAPIIYALDQMHANNPSDFGDLMSAVTGEIAGVSYFRGNRSGLPIHPILETPMELLRNQDFYTNEPIVPEHLENQPLPLQVNSRTSQLARVLAPKLGVSPLLFDHLMKDFPGGISRNLVAQSDVMLKRLGLDVEEPLVANLANELSKIRVENGYPPEEIEVLRSEFLAGRNSEFPVPPELRERVAEYERRMRYLEGYAVPFLSQIGGRTLDSSPRGGNMRERAGRDLEDDIGISFEQTTLLGQRASQLRKEQAPRRASNDALYRLTLNGVRWREGYSKLNEETRALIAALSSQYPDAAQVKMHELSAGPNALDPRVYADFTQNVLDSTRGINPNLQTELHSAVWRSFQPKVLPTGEIDWRPLLAQQDFEAGMNETERLELHRWLTRNYTQVEYEFWRDSRQLQEYFRIPDRLIGDNALLSDQYYTWLYALKDDQKRMEATNAKLAALVKQIPMHRRQYRFKNRAADEALKKWWDYTLITEQNIGGSRRLVSPSSGRTFRSRRRGRSR